MQEQVINQPPVSLEERREWPADIIFKMFDLVEQHRVLYDNQDPQWTNKTLKGQLWTNIAKELDPNLNSRRCRDKFVTMRKRYASKLKKQLASGDISFNPSLLWLLDPAEEEKHAPQPPQFPGGEEDKENNQQPCNDLLQLLEQISGSQSPDEEGMANDPGTSTCSETLEELIQRVKASTGSQIVDVAVDPTVAAPIVSVSTHNTESSEASDCDPPSKKQRRKNAAPRRVSADVSPRKAPSNPQLEYFTAMTAAMQEQRNVEEECNLMGKLVAIDLQKLGSQNRARARVAIMKITAELISEQFDALAKSKK